MKQLEKDVQRSILDCLSLLGVFCWRNNSTGTYDPIRKVWRPMRGHLLKGTADIIGCWNGRFVAIEVKVPETRLHVSDDQRSWLQRVVKAGAFAGVCCSVEEAIQFLEDLKNGNRLDGYWRAENRGR